MTTIERHPTVAELDLEIERVRTAAHAELAIGAVSGEHVNPFSGSSERLRELETQRSTLLLRTEGEALLTALAQLEAAEKTIAETTASMYEARNAISDLRAHPVVARWISAQKHARGLYIYQSWAVVERFLKSDAPWSDYPAQAGGEWTSQLPAEFRFTEQDRDVIRKWEALNQRQQQLVISFTSAHQNRELLLKAHAALRILPR